MNGPVPAASSRPYANIRFAFEISDECECVQIAFHFSRINLFNFGRFPRRCPRLPPKVKNRAVSLGNVAPFASPTRRSVATQTENNNSAEWISARTAGEGRTSGRFTVADEKVKNSDA